MGLFDEARANVNREQRSQTRGQQSHEAAIDRLRQGQIALLREFCDGMKRLGIEPMKHEIKWPESRGDKFKRKSYFPKVHIVGYRAGNYIVTSEALYGAEPIRKVHRSNLGPIKLPILDGSDPGIHVYTDDTFRSTLRQALQSHMKS